MCHISGWPDHPHMMFAKHQEKTNCAVNHMPVQGLRNKTCFLIMVLIPGLNVTYRFFLKYQKKFYCNIQCDKEKEELWPIILYDQNSQFALL